MAFTVLAAVGIALTAVTYTYVMGLYRNVAKARKTGLPYIVVPFSPINLISQVTSPVWVPLVKLLLPKWLWENWIFVMVPDWHYHTGQTHWDRLGTETFLVASPGTLALYTQNAELIHQITQRREAFPKNISRYGVLDMFGKNVLTTEGTLWRLHRKITSASFNEKNAAHTFAQAIHQSKGMLNMWFGQEGAKTGTTGTIRSLEHDTMTWALNIIGYVGFGLHMLWPGETMPKDVDPTLAKYGSLNPPAGHKLTFADSLAKTLERIFAILALNETLLRLLPFKFAKDAYQGKCDYLQYMDEFLQVKIEETRRGGPQREGMDIMGQLVQSSYGSEPSSKKGGGASSTFRLSDDNIIGNAFIMMLAGHETTANTLHFALIELAANPSAQRRLQQDVDVIFEDSDPSTWEYEKCINALLASHVGATINETLRLIPPVTVIPKIVTPDAEQTVKMNGQTYVLPRGLCISLVAPGAHRNPRWWPTRPSERTGAPTDLDDFLPDRWYRTGKAEGGQQEKEEDDDDIVDKNDYGGFQGSDVAASLYRPVRGSYLPFSDGPRSCLGRRIAMVEMAAVLAVMFQRYSIELAVDDWASDAEVDTMTPAQRRELYRKAQDRSQDIIRSARSVLTLKLHGGRHVPVRLVERGRERFVNDPELW